MRVLVAGSSGLIGSALVAHLRSAGHDVLRLVRRPPAAPDEGSVRPEAELARKLVERVGPVPSAIPDAAPQERRRRPSAGVRAAAAEVRR